MNYPVPKFNPAKDMRAPHFARVLSKLPATTEMSSIWEDLSPPGNQWWANQREHMTVWFSQAEGPGPYGRRRAQTAGETYGRLLCPPALIWIAEAIGEDRPLVLTAALNAYQRSGVRAQCNEFRRYNPWDNIYRLVPR